MTTTVTLPPVFFVDHKERDLPTPDAIRHTKAGAVVSLADPALPEMLNDAEHYATPGQFDSEYIGLVSSARATRDRIVKALSAAMPGAATGLTGPEWKPTMRDRYFAQIGDSGAFAFGPTVAAALLNLYRATREDDAETPACVGCGDALESGDSDVCAACEYVEAKELPPGSEAPATTLDRILTTHAAPLPAYIDTPSILSLSRFNDSDPASGRDKAMRADESFVTLYSPGVGPAIATLSRPRTYNDCPIEPLAKGLFRLHTTDGRLVAVFDRAPTFAKVRDALCAYVRPVSPQAIDAADDHELRVELADAKAATLRNIETAESASFDTFRASALCRAIRAARRAALAGARFEPKETPACRDCGDALDAEAQPYGQCWDCAFDLNPRTPYMPDAPAKMVEHVARDAEELTILDRIRAAITWANAKEDDDAPALPGARSLSASATPAALADGYDSPVASDSGVSPFRAYAATFRKGAAGAREYASAYFMEQTAKAIDDALSLGLYDDDSTDSGYL